MQSDGSVIIDTSMQTDGIEKGFQRIKDDVGGVADAAAKAGNKIEIEFSRIDISKAVGNARAAVERLEADFSRVSEAYKFALEDGDDKSAERLGAKRAAAYDRLDEARRRLSVEIQKAAAKEAAAEEKAAQKKIAAAEKEAAAKEKAQARQFSELIKPMRRFESRMREIITGALFFNLFSRGLTEMTQYLGTALKSNEAFSASFARLKGALLTAFQPIYEVALPALISLMNVLTAVINAIGRFFAAITGKNYIQMKENAAVLQDQADGIGAVGSAAKKAKKELAGFDEINKLSFADVSSGGGGGASIGSIDADFADGETIANLNQILYLVGAIGAALLGWKIAKLFTDDLSVIAGVAMAAGGGFLMAANWADAFANGINWENLTGLMQGFMLVVGGLALAFGATGAAVGLLVGGVALVVLSIKEWIETGELGEEACAALVVGIMAIGTAISLLTGGPIPAIIAAIVAFCIACVTNGDKIKEALNGVLDWIRGIFQRDWRELFGETLGSIFNGFSELIIGIIDGLELAFGGLIDFISGVFTGDWELAWQGVVQVFEGVWKGVGSFLQVIVNGIWAVINGIKRALNSISVTIPDWVPKYGGKKIGFNFHETTPPQIPWLAKGAVIPANNPFLAVLGDQKRGTNIEAPLSTIEQAVENVMRRHSGVSDERIIVLLSQILEAILGIEIDGETLSRAIDNYRRKEAVSRG